jgi:Phytanoyl-CoA dioxygenase (PhyH)
MMSMIETYRERGFHLERGLFPIECANIVLREIDSIFRARMSSLRCGNESDADGMLTPSSLAEFFKSNGPDYIACMKAVQNLYGVIDYVANSNVLSIITALGIRSPAFSTKQIVMISSPRTASSFAHWKKPPHQDWRSIQGSLNGIVVWTALADVTPQIGPLEVIPGSHLWGLLPTKQDEWYRHINDQRIQDDAFVSVPMKAGDALFFSSFLIHRSGSSDGSRPRYSIQFRFNDLAEQSFIDRGYPSTYPSDRPEIDFVTEDNMPTGDDVRLALGMLKEKPAC